MLNCIWAIPGGTLETGVWSSIEHRSTPRVGRIYRQKIKASGFSIISVEDLNHDG